MSTATLILTIVYAVVCVFLTCVVLFQSGKSSGLSGAISGGGETFLAKNKARSIDARLAKATKWVAIVFMILTLALSLVK